MSVTPRLKPRPLSSIPAAVSTVTRTYVTYSTSEATPTVASLLWCIRSYPKNTNWWGIEATPTFLTIRWVSILQVITDIHFRQFPLLYPRVTVSMKFCHLKPNYTSLPPASIACRSVNVTVETTPTVAIICFTCYLHTRGARATSHDHTHDLLQHIHRLQS